MSMYFLKRFTEWIGLKEKLDNIESKPPLFKEGEIWWCSIGENIGVEISGKGDLFSRPVVIFKKLSKEVFLGLPMTTKIKKGSWYIDVIHNQTSKTVVLSQVRIFDVKRLSSKLGQLDDNDFNKIKTGFGSLFLSNIFLSSEGQAVGNPKYNSSIAEQKSTSTTPVNIEKELLRNLEIGQIWQHYKGNQYEILFFTKHSETGEVLVVYQRVEDGHSYARPLDLFFSTVELEGQKVARFTYIRDN